MRPPPVPLRVLWCMNGCHVHKQPRARACLHPQVGRAGAPPDAAATAGVATRYVPVPTAQPGGRPQAHGPPHMQQARPAPHHYQQPPTAQQPSVQQYPPQQQFQQQRGGRPASAATPYASVQQPQYAQQQQPQPTPPAPAPAPAPAPTAPSSDAGECLGDRWRQLKAAQTVLLCCNLELLVSECR